MFKIFNREIHQISDREIDGLLEAYGDVDEIRDDYKPKKKRHDIYKWVGGNALRKGKNRVEATKEAAKAHRWEALRDHAPYAIVAGAGIALIGFAAYRFLMGEAPEVEASLLYADMSNSGALAYIEATGGKVELNNLTLPNINESVKQVLLKAESIIFTPNGSDGFIRIGVKY